MYSTSALESYSTITICSLSTLETSVEKRIVHGCAIRFGYNAKVLSPLGNVGPMTDLSIGLYFNTNGMVQSVRNPSQA